MQVSMCTEAGSADLIWHEDRANDDERQFGEDVNLARGGSLCQGHVPLPICAVQ